MANLYIFSIGGSGSRVLRSLNMLLASGIDINADKIIPLIIDTDKNNGDLARFVELNEFYIKINNSLYNNLENKHYSNHFFRRKIERAKVLNIEQSQYKSLKDLLDYENLTQSGLEKTQYFIELLFKKDEIYKDLEKGFYGKPNIGSIVLREIVESETFQEFTQRISAGDRIFIISSIFGGTGAAGYPLLLKIFRDNKINFNNINFINNSIIGAISILPYFEVDVNAYNKGDSCINSATFIAKSKAALSYYNRNLGDLVNYQYYISDPKKSNYDNYEGAAHQINNSHFIEVAAATSIIHFMNQEKQANNISELSQQKVKYSEFGIHENQNESILSLWNLFDHETNNYFAKPLIAFNIFSYLIRNNHLQFNDKHLVWAKEIGNNIDQTFKSDLLEFSRLHTEWLNELQNNKHQRKFIPFEFEKVNIQDFLSMVKDLPKSTNKNSLNMDIINKTLNMINDSIKAKQITNNNLSFMNLLYEFVENIYSNYNIEFPKFVDLNSN